MIDIPQPMLKRVPLLQRLWRRLRAAYRTRVYPASLRRAVARGPVKIVVGSNGVFDPGWQPTEIHFLNLLKPADWEGFFGEGHPVTAILAEHVWEHLTLEEGRIAAQTCHQFLAPGGYVRAAVPDGLHPDPGYRQWARPGGCGPSSDDHKLFYTYRTFSEVFESAGFRVELLEYFDESGSFHSTDWDPALGKIRRSLRFDRRNRDGRPHYTSVILDAKKASSPA